MSTTTLARPEGSTTQRDPVEIKVIDSDVTATEFETAAWGPNKAQRGGQISTTSPSRPRTRHMPPANSRPNSTAQS